MEALATEERHEIMAALLITRGTVANGAHGAGVHVVVVLLVGVDIRAKGELHMFVVIEVLARHNVTRGQTGGDPIRMGKGIEPELGIAGLCVSGLVTLLWYVIRSHNQREDKRSTEFVSSIKEINDNHRQERGEWRESTNEVLRELKDTIRDAKANTPIK